MSASSSYLNKRHSPTTPTKSNVKRFLNDKIMWVYVIVALVLFLALYLVVRDHMHNVNSWARVPVWLANSFVMGLVVLVVLLLAAWATAVAHGYYNGNYAAGVGGVFIVAGVLLLAVAWLTYQGHNFVAAFYLSLLLLVAVLVHFYFVWNVSRVKALAVVPLILLVLTMVYYLWFMADESTDCIANCGPLYEVQYAVAP